MTHRNGQATLIVGGFGSVATAEKSATSGRLMLKEFDTLPVRDVPVGVLSGGLQVRREGTDSAHVHLLVDAADAADLPPILVQKNGCRVIDGLHRLEAARLRGDQLIKARFLDCTDSEALVLAMEANSSHGLPLSRADRLAGAERVLAAHPDWSDRAIAGITGLSAKTIAGLRGPATGEAPGGKRLGRDGRRRPMTADEGRRRAAEYIRANPGAPLRQVARATDLSLGTVHDVSTRLRLGVSPERDGSRTPGARPPVRPVTEVAAPGVTASSGGTASGVPAPVAAMPGSTPLRQRKPVEVPPAWPVVAANVSRDPTVRYTQGGKEFLRWMALHAADPDGWRDVVTAIPAHWSSVIAPIADSISREWGEFAEQLKRAGSGPVGNAESA